MPSQGLLLVHGGTEAVLTKAMITVPSAIMGIKP